MQPIDIIAVPYAIIMTTPLVILTLTLIGYMCWCIGSIHQEVSLQLTDIEYDEEDEQRYIESEKAKRTLPIKEQLKILNTWRPNRLNPVRNNTDLLSKTLVKLTKEFDNYYVAYCLKA